MTETKAEYKPSNQTPLSFSPFALRGFCIQSVEKMQAEIPRTICTYLLIRGRDKTGREHRIMFPGNSMIKPCPDIVDVLDNLKLDKPFFTLDELRARLNHEPLEDTSDS